MRSLGELLSFAALLLFAATKLGSRENAGRSLTNPGQSRGNGCVEGGSVKSLRSRKQREVRKKFVASGREGCNRRLAARCRSARHFRIVERSEDSLCALFKRPTSLDSCETHHLDLRKGVANFSA